MGRRRTCFAPNIPEMHTVRVTPSHDSGIALFDTPRSITEMRRILLIDDEEDIREVASLSLEAMAGWFVTTASSGALGIEAAIADPPEAIVLDVMMPGMDGPTTFREMQLRPEIAHIPVILLTAKVQGVDQRRFADLGVAAVLFKPFDPMTLAQQIADVLNWKLVAV
jgi:CheY-like chemotaxis protein